VPRCFDPLVANRRDRPTSPVRGVFWRTGGCARVSSGLLN